MKAAVTVFDKETLEVQNVFEWRQSWFLHGGFNRRNARILAELPQIDYRYANKVLASAKQKGHDEEFVMKLLI